MPTDSPNSGLVGTRQWLLDLPTEVSHAIYSLLFCEERDRIWLAKHYKLWPKAHGAVADPIFATAAFRLSTKLHEDTTRFAYSFNDFMIRDDFATFCQLGDLAIKSIRNLTVVQGGWRPETDDETKAWAIIQHRCETLVNLQVTLHSDMLIPSIAHLEEFREVNRDRGKHTSLAIDLHVWDRHFSFGLDSQECARARQQLVGKFVRSQSSPDFIDPRKRILRLPTQACQIILQADVATGAVRAVDDYLASLDSPPLTKMDLEVPGEHSDYPAPGGRSKSYRYTLRED